MNSALAGDGHLHPFMQKKRKKMPCIISCRQNSAGHFLHTRWKVEWNTCGVIVHTAHVKLLAHCNEIVKEMKLISMLDAF